MSTLRAAGWDGCGRLWAKLAMQSDYMGALALGMQQKVGRNGPIGEYLEQEVEVRERQRHVHECGGARLTSALTDSLDRMAEASKRCRTTCSSLHHQVRGTSNRLSDGKVRTMLTPAGARPSTVGENDACGCPKQHCARQDACGRAHCSAQAHAPARSLSVLETRQVVPPTPMGVESPYFSALGACNTYIGQCMPLAIISGAYTRHVYRL